MWEGFETLLKGISFEGPWDFCHMIWGRNLGNVTFVATFKGKGRVSWGIREQTMLG